MSGVKGTLYFRAAADPECQLGLYVDVPYWSGNSWSCTFNDHCAGYSCSIQQVTNDDNNQPSLRLTVAKSG